MLGIPTVILLSILIAIAPSIGFEQERTFHFICETPDSAMQLARAHTLGGDNEPITVACQDFPDGITVRLLQTVGSFYSPNAGLTTYVWEGEVIRGGRVIPPSAYVFTYEAGRSL